MPSLNKSIVTKWKSWELSKALCEKLSGPFLNHMGQGWANYVCGPNPARLGFLPTPSINGQHIFIALPSLYVIRSLYKFTSNQFKLKINDASVVVRTHWHMENLGIIMRPLQKKVCSTLI